MSEGKFSLVRSWSLNVRTLIYRASSLVNQGGGFIRAIIFGGVGFTPLRFFGIAGMTQQIPGWLVPRQLWRVLCHEQFPALFWTRGVAITACLTQLLS